MKKFIKEFIKMSYANKMTVKQHFVVIWVVISITLATSECIHLWMYLPILANLIASICCAGHLLKNLKIEE